MMTLIICFMIVSKVLINEPVNVWIWSPATGNPNSYIVYRKVVGDIEWEIINVVPHKLIDVNGREMIRYEMPVDGEINYQLSIRAMDAAGNKGILSLASKVVHNRRTNYLLGPPVHGR